MAGFKFLKRVKTRLSANSTIKSDEEEPLSPMARLFNAPQFSPFVITVLGCSTRMDVEVIKDGLKHTLIKHPRFSSKLGLAEMMESKTKGKWNWGTAIGYAVLPFHISLRDDPLDYIRAAKAAMDRKKQSLEPQCTYATAKITLKTLGLQALTTLTYRVISNTTLSFSNIVGPKQEISFYGHPIVYLVPSVYGHPQALTVHFQSYVDKMTLVIAVDKTVIPDPQRLCDDIEESLNVAKKAVVDNKLKKS